jgi:putative PIN family toxin of toxin-antitoxin system
MAKIVVDANVLISAAFGGRPLEAVVKAMANHEIFVSEPIERELKGVFTGLSRKLSNEQISFIQENIRRLLSSAKRVSMSTQVVLSRDAKDDHYLLLCKEARADFLITGDKDLLSIPQEKLNENDVPTLILTPHKFLESSE